MANTTNFGWETPDDTDLVKDGALAMRTLGNSIDTSFVDLKGGTTGQNLRKATNTDLDFTWAGDATNTVIDAEGDLLVGDSADTLQRLAIGTTGQVLTVDTTIDGKIKWADAAGGGKVLQVIYGSTTTETSSSSATYADTNLTATITPSSTASRILVLVAQAGIVRSDGNALNRVDIRLLRGATQIIEARDMLHTATTLKQAAVNHSIVIVDSPSTTSATTYKTQFSNPGAASSVSVQAQAVRSTIVLMEIGA